MRKKKFLLSILALMVAVSAWIFVSRVKWATDLKEDSAPPLQLVEGNQISYSTALEEIAGTRKSLEIVKGKVVLINFWASWCAPCVREMPGLYKMQNKWKEKNFQVLGVSMDDDPTQGLESLKRVVGAAPFQMFRGQDSAISALFPIEGLPYSVIIDRDGKIQYAQAGEVDWTSPEALKWIERLL